MTTTNLLQWNCRGFRSNKHELDLLISKYSPSAICIQEIFMCDDINLRGYVNYDLLSTVDQENRPHGGVSLLIRQDIPQYPIPINTNIQAVAAKITLNRPVSICSIYLPPSQPISVAELNNIY